MYLSAEQNRVTPSPFDFGLWTWIVTILNWNIHILSMSLISAVRIWSRDYGNTHHLKCSKWKNWRHPTNSYHLTNNFCQLGNYENKNVSSFYLSKFFVIVTYWLCTLYRIRSTQMIFFTIVFLTLFVQFVEQITKITDLWGQSQDHDFPFDAFAYKVSLHSMVK